MKDTYSLLEAIATHDLGCTPTESKELLDVGVGLLSKLCDGGPSVEETLLEIVIRALETRILADNVLLNLARFWPAYAGQADTIIEERIGVLFGAAAPPALVDYVKKCVRRNSDFATSKSTIPHDILERLVERVAKDPANNNQLRCSTCGYHFRPDDMGDDRRELVADAGIELATSLMPGRNTDPYKPIATFGIKNPISLLQLGVDHVTPEAGLGWTDVENLRFACAFCNNGKSIYRRARESFGTSVASSLMLLADKTRHTMLKQQTVVATLAGSQGACIACNASRTTTELTVRPKNAPVVEREWFVPWSLRVVCYVCA